MEQRPGSMEDMEMNLKFWKNKTVFITGHTGFKGSWLSLWLQELGASVFGYALLPPTTPSLFELAQVEEGMVSVIDDIRNFNSLLATVQKYRPEIIIHMAAQSLVRQSYNEPVETYETNAMGTVHLFETIRQTKGVRAVVNVTTDKCYENKEWLWGYRESEPLGGHDPYSSSKACSEQITSAFRNSFFSPEKYLEHGVAVASARAGNVIGGGDWARDRLIPDCVSAWLKGETARIRCPEAVRPWQHVLESLSGYMLLAERLYEQGDSFAEAWNFGPNESSVESVEEVISELSRFWGEQARWERDSDDHPHEAHYLKLDCSKARTKLGWAPCWDLTTALRKTAEWYQAYRKQPQKIREKTLEQIREYMKEQPC
jgi:CDP-glucose 4,6-dehydratase